MHSWNFYTKTRNAWEAIYSDCQAAKQSIDCEQFIFRNDKIGGKFLDLFIEKARAGVKVRLLCDMVGSVGLYLSSWPKKLRKASVQIKFYNPIRLWRLNNFTSWYFRDHRKILVIDSNIGYVGGVNFGDYMHDWRDTHLRISGPVVGCLKYSFGLAFNSFILQKFLKAKVSFLEVGNYFCDINDIPRRRQRIIYKKLLKEIKGAEKYIYMTTPYFVPSLRFYIKLLNAAKRGVDVRLIVPSRSDVKIVNYAACSYFGTALKTGIKIYEYLPAILHAKTTVIDDKWATVGSCNLDNISFNYNREANISSTDTNFATELKKHFFDDIAVSRELTFEKWRKRPLINKIRELLTWPIHGLL